MQHGIFRVYGMKYLNNMEINNYDINLDSLVIHWVGNKSNDDGITISKHKVELTENTSSILLKYFISSFKYDDLYKFHHTSNLELNEVYNYVSNIFQNRSCILEQSQLLAKFLYELSTHPNIKSGEFYVAYFTNCEVENINTDAIGIFKSENKETFLEVYSDKENFAIECGKGININKLDKGCLIYNIDKDNGYVVSVIDNTNKKNEAKYWINSFLHLDKLSNDYHNTKALLSLSKNFVTKQIPNEFEISKVEQAELLNNTVKYFKENNSFTLEDFSKQVIGDQKIIDSFNKYKESYEQKREISIEDNFEISENAVNKQVKDLKSVVKLDENFHIYIHGDNQMIKRGYDNASGLYYYQLFFKEEK